MNSFTTTHLWHSLRINGEKRCFENEKLKALLRVVFKADLDFFVIESIECAFIDRQVPLLFDLER